MTLALIVVFMAAPAYAQIGGILKGVQTAQKVRDIQMTDEQEQQLGALVSEKIRARYGVVQDSKIHRYVALVGTVLAQASERPGLKWQFVVLDTDGVNAFAAPGGFIHITRGALGLLQNEAELAGVLAHELIHVTEKHTIRAIQKGKMVDLGADQTGGGFLVDKLVDKATDVVLAGFGRAEEIEADEKGLVLVAKVGYAAGGLNAFLNRLMERNKAATIKQGLFASHPEMKERIGRNEKQASKITGGAVLEERYKSAITFEAKPQTEIALVEEGAAGLTSGAKTGEAKTEEKKEEEPKKRRGFGLGGLLKPGGTEKKSAQVTASGGSRGVDTERNAKGGSVSTLVAVNLTAADITVFKKEGNLR